MSRTQRLALLGVAAVIAVVALIAIPRGDDDDNPQPAAQTTTQPAAETTVDDAASTTETAPAPKPKPKPKPVLLRAGRERELEYKKGETVRFRVRHSAPEEVHVHGYDISRELEAGKTETISFKATIEGIFEIELEQSGTPIASLKVEPR